MTFPTASKPVAATASRPGVEPIKPFYYACRATGRFIFFCTMRLWQIRPELGDREGGYLLALTHLGHLDPFCSSILLRRPMHWMTRREFFVNRIYGWLLSRAGAFPVNRQGIPVRAIRRAIGYARDGRIVGICPEGGRKLGADAAVRGGRIRKGVCSIAIRAGVPIVPCVMVGTHDLSRVGPWLPFKRARLWVAYGEAIHPPPGPSTREKRERLREQLSETYQRLYREVCDRYGIDDAWTP